jgi:hypothetical protein
MYGERGAIKDFSSDLPFSYHKKISTICGINVEIPL